MSQAPSARSAAPVEVPVGIRTLSLKTGSTASGPPVAVPRPPFAWKSRVLLPLVLVAGFAGSLAYTARDALWPATAVKVVPVMVAPAAGGGGSAATVAVQAPGWLEADPFAIAVTALADGVVKEVLVLEGQRVEKDQVVAQLIDDDARLALARAEAELALRQATLKAAQDGWDHPTERTRAVDAANGKVGQIRAELKMLDAEIAAAAARTEELRYESDRLARAFEDSAAAPLEAVIARQRFAAAEATLEATRRRQNVLGQQLAQAQAELTAATEHQRLRIDEAQALAEAKAARDLARAARDEAQLRLDRMQVRSPAAGLVMSRLVEPGSKLILSMDHPLSAVVARIYDPNKLQVRVDVPLADAAKVFVGQDAEVTVAKFPDQVFKARVTRVVREADLQKNTQQFKVGIVDPHADLTPEMLARAKFLAPATTAGASASGATAIYAPASLVRRDGESVQGYVWIVEPIKSVAAKRAVTIGTGRREGWLAIESGLAAGDRLIADAAGLTEGQKVRVTEEATGTDGDPSTGKEAARGVH